MLSVLGSVTSVDTVVDVPSASATGIVEKSATMQTAASVEIHFILASVPPGRVPIIIGRAAGTDNSRFRETSRVTGARPATQYARSGELSIAFQVLGEGPPDVLFTPGFVTNLELTWDWPPLAAYYQTLAAHTRVILFDKRGTGLSDRVKHMPTTEERMDDLRAVMDAAASTRATLVGVSEGAPLAISFTAAFPDRVTALVLYGPLVKATRSDDYPWAATAEWWEEVAERFERIWGAPEYMRADAAWRAPSEADNDAFVEWWGAFRRLGASPGAAADLARMNARIDVRDLLPSITVPTLVIARERDRVVAVEHARYVARHIPGADYLELRGEDHLPWVGDASQVLTAIGRMAGLRTPLTVKPAAAEHDVLAEASRAAGLSEREMDVLRWVERGKSNAEIATALYITEATVRKHLQNAYGKLGVSSRTAALAALRPASATTR